MKRFLQTDPRLIVLNIALVLLLCACGGTYTASKVQVVPLEEQERIIYKNIWLKGTVGVLSVSSENQDGFLKARLRFKNMTTTNVNAEIKVKFLDREGFELNDTWGWAPFILESGEIKAFERLAPLKNAVDFRVLLKLASDED